MFQQPRVVVVLSSEYITCAERLQGDVRGQGGIDAQRGPGPSFPLGFESFTSTIMASRIFSRTMATLTRARQSTPVFISYPTLVSSPLSLTKEIGTLVHHLFGYLRLDAAYYPERGFGSSPDALGIIVIKDLPPTFPAARERLLRLAAKFATLKEDVREKYVDERSQYWCGSSKVSLLQSQSNMSLH
jgi:hypothetical protein